MIIFSFVLAVGCHRKTTVAPRPPSVRVAVVTKETVPLYVATFGKCRSIASVTLVPQVTGILAETKFTEGTMVKAGDPLFEIDPKPYTAALEQAKGDLETAKANLVNAQEALARQQALFEKKVVDIQQLQNSQAALAGAGGDVESSTAAVELAQINLSYCTINSPINGRTGPYLINSGNLVSAGKSELVNVRTLSPIYVDYTISESDFPRVQRYLEEGDDGLEVRITVPSDAKFQATGKLTFIDNRIGSSTGTLALRATVPNDDLKLLPGQFVNVRLILKEMPDSVLVPSSAVLTGANGDYVFVLKPGDTVEQRAVTRGQLEGGLVVISDGLSAGESVVTFGQIALKSGAKVTVLDGKPVSTAK